jgi:hypothetical protein
MDQRVFLRDIDDWELYARGLEAHIASWQEQLTSAFCDSPDLVVGGFHHVYHDVERVVREAADRHARLNEEKQWGCERDRARELRESDSLAENKLGPDET